MKIFMSVTSFMRLGVISTALLALTACAEISSAGKFAWNQTENAAEFIYSPVASFLRDAPKDTVDFDALETGPVIKESEKSVFMAELRGLQDTQDLDFEIFETQTVFAASAELSNNTLSSTAIYGKVENKADSQMTIPDIRFAKSDGTSDLEDWFDCEAEADGYMQWTQNGYSADPNFERCMQDLGYAPKSDTQAGDAI